MKKLAIFLKIMFKVSKGYFPFSFRALSPCAWSIELRMTDKVLHILDAISCIVAWLFPLRGRNLGSLAWVSFGKIRILRWGVCVFFSFVFLVSLVFCTSNLCISVHCTYKVNPVIVPRHFICYLQ